MSLLRNGAAWRTVLRVGLGGILIWSGWVKLMSLPSFALTVRAYEVLPVWLIHPFALWLPGAELLVGLLLLLGMWVRSSALTAAGMFVAFAIALGINVVRGSDMTCGCFGLDGTAASLPEALARSIVLLACSALLVVYPQTLLSADGRASARP